MGSEMCIRDSHRLRPKSSKTIENQLNKNSQKDFMKMSKMQKKKVLKTIFYLKKHQRKLISRKASM